MAQNLTIRPIDLPIFCWTEVCKKGHKVAILLMNCLEWLPIYFGILKTGAIAVPLNYRYTAEEIKYCLDLAECDVIVFGPEFNRRIDAIKDDIPNVKMRLFVGQGRPRFSKLLCADRLLLFGKPEIKLSEGTMRPSIFVRGHWFFPKQYCTRI